MVDVDLGHPGIWVNLANIDFVNDIPPNGTNSAQSTNAIHSSWKFWWLHPAQFKWFYL
jgi:hypothetical protein